MLPVGSLKVTECTQGVFTVGPGCTLWHRFLLLLSMPSVCQLRTSIQAPITVTAAPYHNERCARGGRAHQATHSDTMSVCTHSARTVRLPLLRRASSTSATPPHSSPCAASSTTSPAAASPCTHCLTTCRWCAQHAAARAQHAPGHTWFNLPPTFLCYHLTHWSTL